LVISFYEDWVISGNLTKTYLESATLPIPYKKGFTFVGWSDGVNVFSDYTVHQAKDKVIEVTYEAIWQEKTVEELETFLDELIPLVIDENLYFETSYSAFDLQFESSLESVISNEGIYTRPYKDQNVRLSVHVYEANQLIKTINYDVIAKGYKSLDSSFASSYIYRNYSQVDDLFFETLDVINTAFITANGQGNLSGSSYLSNVKQYIMPRAKENGNWVIMSVAPESSWSSIASSQQSIDTLANQIVEFINVHGFDGVDIDWETPTDSEKTRFTALMKTVYQKVKSNNPNHLVTTAITGGMWQPPRYDLINSQIYLDYINLMTYGMTSSNGQYQNALYKSTTFHNTSLKLGASLNTASIDESVKMLKNSYGVPYSKIVVGVAFYGIKQTRTYNEQTNTFDAFKNAGSVYYNHIENIYMTDSSYELVYDTGAGVPYIYKKDGTEFISFDNPQSILEKGNYILKNKLGGMMFWEYGTDPTNRLLEAVKQGMGK
jgi:chitinase